MDLPRLLRVSLVAEPLITELLAGQVENRSANDIVAVEVSAVPWNSVHFSAENVLGEERRDGALPQRAVFPRPVPPHARRAGVRAPDERKSVVQIPRSLDSPVFSSDRMDSVVLPTEIIVSHKAPPKIFPSRTNGSIIQFHPTTWTRRPQSGFLRRDKSVGCRTAQGKNSSHGRGTPGQPSLHGFAPKTDSVRGQRRPRRRFPSCGLCRRLGPCGISESQSRHPLHERHPAPCTWSRRSKNRHGQGRLCRRRFRKSSACTSAFCSLRRTPFCRGRQI